MGPSLLLCKLSLSLLHVRFSLNLIRYVLQSCCFIFNKKCYLRIEEHSRYFKPSEQYDRYKLFFV